jgi:glycosyltransferase involved in cell wall biosynthesis
LLDHITPLILTKNEEANIERTLRQLGWAHEVVIVDNLSTDATVTIAQTFPNVRVEQGSFATLAEQAQFGVNEIRTPWLLAMDADYFVPDDFVAELASVQPLPEISGYTAQFIYAIHGRRLRASLYPPRDVLLRTSAVSYWQDGHTQRVRIDGAVAPMTARIIHDDRKSFRRFVDRQRRYMREEALKLRTAPPYTLNLPARLRKLIVVAPFAVVFHTLFVRRTILDGWAGLYYAFERFVAELILSRELLRRR